MKHVIVRVAIMIKRVRSVCETEYPKILTYGFMPTLWFIFRVYKYIILAFALLELVDSLPFSSDCIPEIPHF
jgi:hypothetical protein